MSKICILGDPHFGKKNNSQVILDYYREFYEDIFFPILKENCIKELVIMGDNFDIRKQTNHATLNAAKDILFRELYNRGIHTQIIVGNHDAYNKNTLTPNSPRLLLSGYSNVNIIDFPQVSKDILFLPWICADNYEECMTMIKNVDAKYCMAHLELKDFLNNSYVMQDGMELELFKKFKKVLTGHYHTKQEIGNCTYVGTPYQMTWADCDDIKCFHIFDTVTGELEAIPNPSRLFYKLTYDENIPYQIPNITNKIVKVIVENKTSQKKFDKYFEQLSSQNPFELKIIENHCEYDEINNDVDLTIDSTETIISKYIDSCELSVEKEKLKMIFKQLHNEASLL